MLLSNNKRLQGTFNTIEQSIHNQTAIPHLDILKVWEDHLNTTKDACLEVYKAPRSFDTLQEYIDTFKVQFYDFVNNKVLKGIDIKSLYKEQAFTSLNILGKFLCFALNDVQVHRFAQEKIETMKFVKKSNQIKVNGEYKAGDTVTILHSIVRGGHTTPMYSTGTMVVEYYGYKMVNLETLEMSEQDRKNLAVECQKLQKQLEGQYQERWK